MGKGGLFEMSCGLRDVRDGKYKDSLGCSEIFSLLIRIVVLKVCNW